LIVLFFVLMVIAQGTDQVDRNSTEGKSISIN